MKKFVAFLLITSHLIALEFGQIGNTPASVGGAGVAYRKNAWAVYYNPAILGANRQASIAYSFGVGYADNNVLELASIDIKSLQNLSSEIEGLTKNATTQSATRAATTQNLKARSARNTATQADTTTNNTWKFGDLGLLGDVLSQLTGKNGSGTGGNGGTSEDLKTYLCGKVGSGTTKKKARKNANDECSLDNIKEKLQGNNEAINTIQKELGEAINKTAEKHPDKQTALGLLGSIVSNLDPSKIPEVVDSVKGGSFSVKDILIKVGNGGLSISKSAVPSLEGVFVIADTIDKNSLNISSNNGIVWHIKGAKNRGAIGMGLLANIYGFAGVELDSARKEIIIKTGGTNSGDGDYFKVGISGDKITLSSSDKSNFESSSIFSDSANHKLHANGIAITEVPIAYGHTIPLPVGDLHLGATMKYIFAASLDNTQKFNFDKFDINFKVGENLRYTHNFSIDLGALWTMKWLGVGLVAKNLTAPAINTANGKYRILPQVRAGFSAEVWKLTFLADIDLTPNDTLEPGKKNQMVGGGAILDLKWVDFRFGMMGDMHKNPYGPIFTLGMNIAHFLDFSIQTSAKLVDLGEYTNGLKMPNYFKVNVGGRFQW